MSAKPAFPILAFLHRAVIDSLWPMGDCSYLVVSDICQCILFLFPGLTRILHWVENDWDLSPFMPVIFTDSQKLSCPLQGLLGQLLGRHTEWILLLRNKRRVHDTEEGHFCFWYFSHQLPEHTAPPSPLQFGPVCNQSSNLNEPSCFTSTDYSTIHRTYIVKLVFLIHPLFNTCLHEAEIL